MSIKDIENMARVKRILDSANITEDVLKIITAMILDEVKQTIRDPFIHYYDGRKRIDSYRTAFSLYDKFEKRVNELLKEALK